jgi:hypothetical protein
VSSPPQRRAIIIAGDSHGDAYNGLTWSHPGSGTEFSAFAANISGQAAAAEITQQDGKFFHPHLVEAFHKAAAVAQRVSDQAPFVVLSLAGSDAVQETADPMWGVYDFILPDMPALTDRSKRCLQYEVVKSWVERRLAPYEKALDLFKAAGIRIDGILPPPPAYRNNRKFREVLVICKREDLFVAPFPIRGKIAWMTRCYLADLAARRGIPFIDTWPTLQDGRLFLRTEYEMEGLHVSPAAGEALMRLLCESLSQRLPRAA